MMMMGPPGTDRAMSPVKIKSTELADGRIVSTVDNGTDFETGIIVPGEGMGNNETNGPRRWDSKAEALRGHDAIVADGATTVLVDEPQPVMLSLSITSIATLALDLVHRVGGHVTPMNLSEWCELQIPDATAYLTDDGIGLCINVADGDMLRAEFGASRYGPQQKGPTCEVHVVLHDARAEWSRKVAELTACTINSHQVPAVAGEIGGR